LLLMLLDQFRMLVAGEKFAGFETKVLKVKAGALVSAAGPSPNQGLSPVSPRSHGGAESRLISGGRAEATRAAGTRTKGNA